MGGGADPPPSPCRSNPSAPFVFCHDANQSSGSKSARPHGVHGDDAQLQLTDDANDRGVCAGDVCADDAAADDERECATLQWLLSARRTNAGSAAKKIASNASRSPRVRCSGRPRECARGAGSSSARAAQRTRAQVGAAQVGAAQVGAPEFVAQRERSAV